MVKVRAANISYMFVGEVLHVSANKGEGIITIGPRGDILWRSEVGQNFLDDYCDTRVNQISTDFIG
jgi:hypothetical protein